MIWTADFNDILLPRFGNANVAQLTPSADDIAALTRVSDDMTTLSAEVSAVVDRGCTYDLPSVPFRLGNVDDPIVLSEIRGRWTPRAALFIGATIDSIRYVFASVLGAAPVPPAPPGSNVPDLPPLLESVRSRLARHDAWLRTHPVSPDALTGGFVDVDGDGAIGDADELLVDLFEPGKKTRVFDFRGAAPIDRVVLPKGAFTPTAALPGPRCGYRRWHVDTLFDADVGTTDGMSFSPDGTTIAFPKRIDGRYQVHTSRLDGSGLTCLTCSHPASGNDGVRFRPGHADTVLFISTRDHPHSVGGAGGGFGQELYAMRADGSGATRLTTSGAWATNYHANFSHDGQRLVWGTTQNRTWDVMVADFVDDVSGIRLENVRRLTHDTSWWESHDFSVDGTKVLATNTRAGWQSADLYAIDVASGALTRLTDDLAWDEHAHLSPDGRKISWISGRWRPASVWRMTDGSLGAAYDFYWIGPGIFFNFLNPPAGFATELTLMDADGTGVTRLTSDDEVCADNVWSPDGTKILFRQTPTATKLPAKLRLLTFDDCR
jgi:Tol biopolymer transport system component